jgi:hypothetical protein
MGEDFQAGGGVLEHLLRDVHSLSHRERSLDQYTYISRYSYVMIYFLDLSWSFFLSGRESVRIEIRGKGLGGALPFLHDSLGIGGGRQRVWNGGTRRRRWM